MKASLVYYDPTIWTHISNACRVTQGSPLKKEITVSNEFKRKLFISEHSPIRLLVFGIQLFDIPSYVSVHLVRHTQGVQHFVESKRKVVNQSEVNRLTEVDHLLWLNAQALINISRKRLCSKTDKVTKQVWKLVLETIAPVEKELYSLCVPECNYRGFCPEFISCSKEST